MRKSKSLALGFLLLLIAYMASKLRLSPLQRAQVDSLLDIRHREFSKIVAPVRPQLDSAREATRVQIKRLLDPGQQQRFQDWVNESKKEEAKQQ